jgi:hypothetical protein
METTKLSKEEFVLKAIETLRTDRSKGIHVVWSGFNAAFERYFGVASRETTASMSKAGLLDVQPMKGGAMIYKKSDAPDRTLETIAKIIQ